MVNQSTAIINALKKISDTFGIDYLKKHINSPMSKAFNDNTLKLFYGFESNERPDLEPNFKGWTVYATVEVDMNTGEANMIDYVLPDGTKMKDDIQNSDRG